MRKFIEDLITITAVLCLAGLTFSATVWAVREMQGFSSPSSAIAASNQSPAIVIFDDPNDIMYWPSIDELQWFARTKRDGAFRKESQDAYEARRWVWYNNLSATATWPSELMVREVK